MTHPKKFLGAQQLLPHCGGVSSLVTPCPQGRLLSPCSYAQDRLLQATLVRAGTMMELPRGPPR